MAFFMWILVFFRQQFCRRQATSFPMPATPKALLDRPIEGGVAQPFVAIVERCNCCDSLCWFWCWLTRLLFRAIPASAVSIRQAVIGSSLECPATRHSCALWFDGAIRDVAVVAWLSIGSGPPHASTSTIFIASAHRATLTIVSVFGWLLLNVLFVASVVVVITAVFEMTTSGIALTRATVHKMTTSIRSAAMVFGRGWSRSGNK